MAHATDKQVYAYAKLMFEAENPGRSFDQGPLIRSAGQLCLSKSARKDERRSYVRRARDAFEWHDRPGRRERIVGAPVR